MRYINFLKISFCLLLNVSILYSSAENKPKNIEVGSSKRILDWRTIMNLHPKLTPRLQLTTALTHRDTYKRNNDGKFTCSKAILIIDQLKVKHNLYENPTTFPSSENPSYNPMAWICSKGAITEAKLTEKERLKIGQYFLYQKLVDNEVMEKALTACMRNPEHNSTIIEFMQNKKEELHS